MPLRQGQLRAQVPAHQPKPVDRVRPRRAQINCLRSKVRDSAFGGSLAWRGQRLGEQPSNNRRRERGAANRHITLRRIGGRHVGPRRGELNLLAATRLQQNTLTRINRGNAYDLRIRSGDRKSVV